MPIVRQGEQTILSPPRTDSLLPQKSPCFRMGFGFYGLPKDRSLEAEDYSRATPLFQAEYISSTVGISNVRTMRKPSQVASVRYQMLLGN